MRHSNPTRLPLQRRTAISAVLVAGAIVAACSSSPSGTLPATDTAGVTTISGSESATSPPPVTTTVPATDAPSTTSPLPTDPLQIDTDLGAVRGIESGQTGVRSFLTIPYAAPPTGDNRWRDPQPATPWTAPLDATKPGAACPQVSDGFASQIIITPASDEDCLTLNVWSPDTARDLPVMVWFHGGSFLTGSAHNPYYIGDTLAGHGAVVVGVNYRLGALGWMADQSLAAESEDGSYGNYGLADQTAALEWVQRNIASFGGNPDNVTIFGESAGGFSVCGHLASTKSAGLFDRAIIQSGGGCNRVTGPVVAEKAAGELRTAVGCTDIACMRALPIDALLAAPFEAGLVRDGVTLDATARELADQGKLDDIDIMTGSNASEATLFTFGAKEPTDAELADMVGRVTSSPDTVLALYPAADYPNNLSRFRDIFTEAIFTCPALDFAGAVPNSYAYYYTYVPASNPFGVGATHGAEIGAVFGHPEGLLGLNRVLDDATTAVAEQVQIAWTTFAATGTPQSATTPGGWPKFADAGKIMQLDAPFAVVDQIRGGRCPALMEALTP